MYESSMGYECVFNEITNCMKVVWINVNVYLMKWNNELMNYELRLMNCEFNVLINNEFRIWNTMNVCTTNELSNDYDWLIASLIYVSKQGVIGRVLSVLGEGKLVLSVKY